MNKKPLLPLIVLSLLLLPYAGSAQHEDRQPAVAGQFYPSQPDTLRRMLHDLFSAALPSKHLNNVVAIIVPHAGYPYSGRVAASGFNQIDPARQYDNIFILGPSHYVGFEGASVYSQGDFVTPLGTIRVNREIAEDLLKKSDVFVSRTDAHAREHSVEVQLPFLQYLMKKSYRIVPIVIGAGSPETCSKIAVALRPYLTPKNLFIISTDFSHYPSSEDARSVDKATAEAVVTNSPEALMRAVKHNEERNVPNLVTSMCGWSCVTTLLYMTRQDPQIAFDVIEYRNSGDVPSGDRGRVVGYYAIAVSLKKTERPGGFNLNEREKKVLLGVARNTLERYLRSREIPAIDTTKLSPAVKAGCGAFVTLSKGGVLRGCVGRFDAAEPLYSVVQQMAIAAAVDDGRFLPVDAGELGTLDIEISVLTPMRKISSIDEFHMGKQGIYMRKGNHAGTFLPQVAGETGWSKEEFLGHCAQDKAGLGWDGWKDAELFVYEAIAFAEKDGL